MDFLTPDSDQTAQGMACPSCGEINKPGAKFCRKDGTPLSAIPWVSKISGETPASAENKINATPADDHLARVEVATGLDAAVSVDASPTIDSVHHFPKLICTSCNDINEFDARACKKCGAPFNESLSLGPGDVRVQDDDTIPPERSITSSPKYGPAEPVNNFETLPVDI